MVKSIPSPDAFCCAPDCMDTPLELAPVPLCGKHLRETYEFAAALVDTRWATAIREQRAELAEQAARQLGEAPPATWTSRQTEGFVYFIRFSDRIKIGWSSKPDQRLRDLPHDEVLVIIPGTIQDEHGYHARFHHLRCTGEWFRAEPELIQFVHTLLPAA